MECSNSNNMGEPLNCGNCPYSQCPRWIPPCQRTYPYPYWPQPYLPFPQWPTYPYSPWVGYESTDKITITDTVKELREDEDKDKS